jgi:membrane protease YdiL (CAAX protease family)
MLGITLLVAVGLLRWASQGALRMYAGQPVWPWVEAELPKRLKKVNRTAGNLAIAAAIVAYPYFRGQDPRIYYGHLLPPDFRIMEGLHGFLLGTFFLAVLYLAWTATDNVRFRIRHPPRRLALRLAVVPLSAVFGALVEELLFRGIILADLLEYVDPIWAVAAGAILFAGAHYARRVKRYWTLAGHLALGVLLCATFVWTRKLWLPMGLHAAGIFLTLGTRPFVRSTGPAWLVGASIFPYSGLIGVIALILLTLTMGLAYGGWS